MFGLEVLAFVFPSDLETGEHNDNRICYTLVKVNILLNATEGNYKYINQINIVNKRKISIKK